MYTDASLRYTQEKDLPIFIINESKKRKKHK